VTIDRYGIGRQPDLNYRRADPVSEFFPTGVEKQIIGERKQDLGYGYYHSVCYILAGAGTSAHQISCGTFSCT
jgi:hypothetical protein